MSIPHREPDHFRTIQGLEDEIRRINQLLNNARLGVGVDWRAIGSPGEVPFENSWTNYGTYADAAFSRDALGIVRLRGLVTGGSLGTTIFTLPEGYRPPLAEIFAVSSNNSIGRVDVGVSGVVRLVYVGSPTYVSLSGISFAVEWPV